MFLPLNFKMQTDSITILALYKYKCKTVYNKRIYSKDLAFSIN